MFRRTLPWLIAAAVATAWVVREQAGDTDAAGGAASGRVVRVVEPDQFGNLLQHATGSAAHNIRLRELAVRQGLSVSQHGIAGPGDEVAVHADEDGVYAALGLHLIPPELREDRGEFDLAEAGELPDLVTADDIRGDLHMHTTASDGHGTIREMAEAAKARGLKYIAITDHSQKVAMARGLNAERLRAHRFEVGVRRV